MTWFLVIKNVLLNIVISLLRLRVYSVVLLLLLWIVGILPKSLMMFLFLVRLSLLKILLLIGFLLFLRSPILFSIPFLISVVLVPCRFMVFPVLLIIFEVFMDTVEFDLKFRASLFTLLLVAHIFPRTDKPASHDRFVIDRCLALTDLAADSFFNHYS